MPTADELLSATTVRALVACLSSAAPDYPVPSVRKSATALDGRSLSERSRAVRDALLVDLPSDYAPFESVLRKALDDPAFTGWMIWPVTEALAVRAAESGDDEFDSALALLTELTPLLTGEFALRSFLTADLERTMAAAREWTTHPDEHVRRLASEGTRPHLPWAKKVRAILARPDVTVPVLDALCKDPSEYVRRSVANHLNDISRADPGLATSIAERWLQDPDPATPKLIRHALRTLVKNGDPEALRLLGFLPPTHIALTAPVVHDRTVALGGELRFEFTLENRGNATASLAIDYVIHHRKANNSLRPKVFKLTTRNLAPGEIATIARRHSFKPVSTRTYYPGEHAIEIQINGTRHGSSRFHLLNQARAE